MRPAWLSILVCSALPACVGTTGSDLVTFEAAAAGPADAVDGQPYSFTSGRGYHVTLTCAKLHVGAIYLNRERPTSGAEDTSCILPGFYVAQVTQGRDVDVLSPKPQRFPGSGKGTADLAKVGEVWLTHGDVDAPDDPGVVLDLAGSATLGDAEYPFQGTLTIGENRAATVTDPSMPSAHPICKQRIVTPLTNDAPASGNGLDLTPETGGTLLLRVKPSAWFSDVEFSRMSQAEAQASGACAAEKTGAMRYTFMDTAADTASDSLYAGLHYHETAYYFSFAGGTEATP